jgi:PST family polysaccharide transporter
MDINEVYNKYKKVINNFISLFIIQSLNYLLPLITVPYLARVLGAKNYGKVIFAIAFITYFQIITDYGFNLSATRDISINKHNINKLNRIFTSVMLIKIIFAILSYFILWIVIKNFALFNNEYKLYLYAFGIVIGSALFPVWLFQGMEEMKYITYLNIITKGFVTFLTFVIIKNQTDYINYIKLNSIGYIMTGLLSLIIVFNKFKLKLIKVKFSDIKIMLIEGWHIFVTTILSSILTNTGPFILGIYIDKQTVGYYGAIDKIVKALSSLFSPLTQAIFPYVSSKFKLSFEEGKKEVYKFAKVVMPICLIITANLMLF